MRTITRWALAGVCVAALGACDAGPAGPTSPAAAGPVLGIEPQPFRVFDFQIAGQRDGRWVGRLGDGGSLTVETLSAQPLGTVTGLVQSWTFHAPPDDDQPPPDDELTLVGILDLAGGTLVLNGTTDAGATVHVQATVVAGDGGTLSIGGDVMFNPQPEPPGHL